MTANGFAEDAFAANRIKIPGHDGKWLHGAALEGAESRHRGFICRVARQMKAADAFDGDDFSRREGCPRGEDRVPPADGMRIRRFLVFRC